VLIRDRYIISRETLEVVLEALGSHWFDGTGEKNNEDIIEAEERLRKEIYIVEERLRKDKGE
jgi:hypothetical protein